MWSIRDRRELVVDAVTSLGDALKQVRQKASAGAWRPHGTAPGASRRWAIGRSVREWPAIPASVETREDAEFIATAANLWSLLADVVEEAEEVARPYTLPESATSSSDPRPALRDALSRLRVELGLQDTETKP